MEAFKDNFSKQSELYVRYRPLYPEALYEFLAVQSPGRALAWDCGTGNGQAAVGLAQHFEAVFASDPSEEQLSRAFAHPKVRYQREKAERSSLPDASADLITVGNALHWFDFEAFYREVDRVLKPQGVLALWCYDLPSVTPEIDAVNRHFHDHVVGPYWMTENQLVMQRYTTIPFPLAEIAAPAFFYPRALTLDEWIGYINTWSALQRFVADKGFNPDPLLREQLQPLWREGEEKTVTWRLALRAGRKA